MLRFVSPDVAPLRHASGRSACLLMGVTEEAPPGQNGVSDATLDSGNSIGGRREASGCGSKLRE
jgi:hypothetical protein